jgi:hypothetical protein
MGLIHKLNYFQHRIRARIEQRLIVIRLERQIREYEDNLPEKHKAWAKDLRRRLKESPDSAAEILVCEAFRVAEKQMRVVEKIEEIHNVRAKEKV